MLVVKDIRKLFRDEYKLNKTRNGTVELQGVSFKADEDYIYGTPNKEYIQAEIAWYLSQDRKVDRLFELYGKPVKIWNDVKDINNEVNSNYGWCIFSGERHKQFHKAYRALLKDPYTRQSVMIYTTPEMHDIAGKDFTCTNAQQFFIKDNKLHSVVQMRSQDAVFGYNNDIAWFKHVLFSMHLKLTSKCILEYPELSTPMKNLKIGDVTMQIGSLHVYERHFNYIEKDNKQLALDLGEL